MNIIMKLLSDFYLVKLRGHKRTIVPELTLFRLFAEL